jgi:hypothetical protein
MMCSRTAVVAVMLAITPLGAKAADLVLSWHKAHHAAEDAALM